VYFLLAKNSPHLKTTANFLKKFFYQSVCQYAAVLQLGTTEMCWLQAAVVWQIAEGGAAAESKLPHHSRLSQHNVMASIYHFNRPTGFSIASQKRLRN
jgi:hypothetical protein